MCALDTPQFSGTRRLTADSVSKFWERGQLLSTHYMQAPLGMDSRTMVKGSDCSPEPQCTITASLWPVLDGINGQLLGTGVRLHTGFDKRVIAKLRVAEFERTLTAFPSPSERATIGEPCRFGRAPLVSAVRQEIPATPHHRLRTSNRGAKVWVSKWYPLHSTTS